MGHKIFRSTMVMTVTVLLCTLILVLGTLYAYYNEAQLHQLRDQLTLSATATEDVGIHFLRSVGNSRYRLTWIKRDGTVIYDTRVPSEQMDNHIDREEFQEALSTGRGSSTRFSHTITKRTIYEAVALSDGTLLRIAVNRASPLGLFLELVPVLLLIIVVMILLAYLMSLRIAKRIVAPINAIDPENPLSGATDPEIAPLLHRIHSQNQQIHAQFREQVERAEEFRQISDSMQEGLILIDDKGHIRSMNPMAQRIFLSQDTPTEYTLHSIDPSGELRDAISTASETGHGKTRILRQGRHYRIDLSRIDAEGAVVGMVLLAIDITESVNAQNNRREFSANVSHELKTPLQTIIGSAELLENDLVKSEDRPRFYGHIQKEARRLLDLVQDILRLSQIDEQAAMTEEPVNLKPLCLECLTELKGKATSKSITLLQDTEDATIIGVPQMLRELIFNLCHNAILYNVEKGQVLLKLENKKDSIVLSVKDTGIGIPPEHQEKVFERFYRVDKSHSRASGGTGLGLSIVKHVAQYHKAPISLTSTPGEGTEVRITFPIG